MMSFKFITHVIFSTVILVSGSSLFANARSEEDTLSNRNHLEITLEVYAATFIHKIPVKWNNIERIYFEEVPNIGVGIGYRRDLGSGLVYNLHIRGWPFWRTKYEHINHLTGEIQSGLIKNVATVNIDQTVHYIIKSFDLGIGLALGAYFGGRTDPEISDFTLNFTNNQGRVQWESHIGYGPKFEIGYRFTDLRVAIFHQRPLNYQISINPDVQITPFYQLGISFGYNLKH